MSTTERDDTMLRLLAEPVDDPEIQARKEHILRVLLECDPEVKQRLVDEVILPARLTTMRTALRLVLACRQLVLSQDDEARIEACTELDTLHRWHRQAVTAPTVADALR